MGRRLRFTKMQGSGNDFVVLDATRAPLTLEPAQYRLLADRRYGVGADQILIVGPSPESGIDFSYRIVNADGGEVEQCGNGARCFVRYVREAGLTDKDAIRVRTAGGVIEPRWLGNGLVRVDMGRPVFELERVPFDADGLQPREAEGMALWPLEVAGRTVEAGVLSMGNPHAVLRVADVQTAPVAEVGAALQTHPRFPRRVNVGFLQVVAERQARLRVYERGAGETLACGTGACAAVVAGVRLGWFGADAAVRVATRGGELTIEWSGGPEASVFLTGTAERVFDGEIELPDGD